jgi:hypothetical protein
MHPWPTVDCSSQLCLSGLPSLRRRPTCTDATEPPVMNAHAAVIEALKRHVGHPDLGHLLRHSAAICASPTNPMPLYRFADTCQRLGDLSGWRAVTDVALCLEHGTYEQLYFRARAKIRLGIWSGWSDYEARFFGDKFTAYQSPYARKLRWSFKAWDGQESLDGRVLLVAFEQGFGDTIQMLRFVPQLAERAGKVIVSIQPLLLTLAQHNFGEIATILPSTSALPDAFDRYVWTMSLPACLGQLPEFTPLAAPSPMDRFSSLDGCLHVGICWAGNPEYGRDDQRSIPVAELAPLFECRGVHWHSLQVGPNATAGDFYPHLRKPPLPLDSFADTANFITALDAVVSVDTAVCHLAASMGMPTILCVNTASVWRWGLENATPWYPSMRIIRQHKYSEWDPTLTAVREHLARVVAVTNEYSATHPAV